MLFKHKKRKKYVERKDVWYNFHRWFILKKQNYFFIFFVVVCIIALIFVYVKTDVYQVTLAIDGEVYKTTEVRKNTEYGSIERPSKEGYTFLGWYDENNNLLEETTHITADSVYYAKWTVIVTDDEETE